MASPLDKHRIKTNQESGIISWFFKYWIEIRDSKKSIGWEKSWSSELFIEADDDVEEFREYLAYDLNDLVGSVGGYLGLFLGWSLLGLTIQVSVFILKYLKTNCRKKF